MLVEAAVRERILDISRRHNLSHVGSCVSCLPILLHIYNRYPDDVVVLSNGHAGLALYCVLEAVFGHDAEALLEKHGVHPCHDPENHIYCSTGSLGMGLAVAAGYAMAGRRTHCVISDGECAEGIVWEVLRFLDSHDIPLSVYLNANGWGAYSRIVDATRYTGRSLYVWRTSNLPMPNSLAAHYDKVSA
jgi:transketolase